MLAPARGIEPRFEASKTSVLPLDEAGIAGVQRVELRLTGPEPGVLPLDDTPKSSATYLYTSQQEDQAA